MAEHGDDVVLDALVPRPLSPGVRLCCALVLVALATGVGHAWSSGMFWPWPEGRWRVVSSTSPLSDVEVTRAPTGDAVVVDAWFENGSARGVEIESVEVDLPGADVRSVALRTAGPGFGQPSRPLPAVVPARSQAWLEVTFVPRVCSVSPFPPPNAASSSPRDQRSWGTVTARLRTRAWWPTSARSYRFPAPVWRWPQPGPGPGSPTSDVRDPLERACALLALR